ncbi:ECF family sigma factor [Bordetella ansorpii]|uniref:ECF family sigma factor n=1 Tax=Bordetella ansorpii TaxID=288768 RepID=A0A157LW32_9BORD|nr:sigma-70 family RNA polymerase sigma factor [Bordetella ansorpii]SAI00646.1 ECF family sigma factor [Bordetella ansorpii]
MAVVYKEHHAWLLNLLRRQLGGGQQADAWDLVQDTFERLMRQSYLEQGAWNRGYLATIAKRLLIDRHRRRALETAYLEALAAQPEATEPSAEMLAQVSQQLLAVCQVLDRMPARMRRIFLLARIDGQAYDTIARTLDVSVNMVQKDLIQAWQRLYHAFDDC